MPSFKMKFSGVTILQGVEFSIFPIDFEWALQQCSATALPVTRPTGAVADADVQPDQSSECTVDDANSLALSSSLLA